MDPEFLEDLTAELAALNTAVIKTLSTVTKFVEKEGVTKKQFLEAMLSGGEKGMEKTNYWAIAEDRRDVVIEKAKARYTDIINAVYRVGT